MAIPRHLFSDGGYYHDYQGVGDTCALCNQTQEEIENQKRKPMTGYERAVEYLRSRGGGAALNALVEEGYEGDGVDYDKLIESFKKDDKAIDKLPKSLGDLQWHGRNAREKAPPYELMVIGRNLSEVKEALDYWDTRYTRHDSAQVPLDTMRELIGAAEQLLAWQPVCSLGSSGDLRQKRLRYAIDRFKGVS